MDINGSVILITSAGTPLGSTLAVHFSASGARVIAIDTDAQKLDEIHFRCKEKSSTVLTYPVKDYSESSIQALFETIKQELKLSIDVLINYWPSLPLPTLTNGISTEKFSEQLTSLASPIFCFGQAGAEHMQLNKKKNLIINMITFPLRQSNIGQDSATCMVSGFTKSWAKELAPFNIRVGCVIPGCSHTSNSDEIEHWAVIQDELIRSAEYIVSNEYFNGRVMAAEA